MKRLPYRNVQRLSDTALERRILSISSLREKRKEEIRETEKRYVRRFLEERPRPEEFAAEIDRDLSLAPIDRDLLINEIFAVSVKRTRQARSEARERKPVPKMVPRLTPDFVRAMPDPAFVELGKDLLGLRSNLADARHGTYDRDYWMGVLDDDSNPIDYYVKKGVSDSDLDHLSFKSFSEPESLYLVNRIIWKLEQKRRRG